MQFHRFYNSNIRSKEEAINRFKNGEEFWYEDKHRFYPVKCLSSDFTTWHSKSVRQVKDGDKLLVWVDRNTIKLVRKEGNNFITKEGVKYQRVRPVHSNSILKYLIENNE